MPYFSFSSVFDYSPSFLFLSGIPIIILNNPDQFFPDPKRGFYTSFSGTGPEVLFFLDLAIFRYSPGIRISTYARAKRTAPHPFGMGSWINIVTGSLSNAEILIKNKSEKIFFSVSVRGEKVTPEGLYAEEYISVNEVHAQENIRAKRRIFDIVTRVHSIASESVVVVPPPNVFG